MYSNFSEPSLTTENPNFTPEVIVLFWVAEFFNTARQTLGRIDIVIGNAGVINEIDWLSCVDVNLVRPLSHEDGLGLSKTSYG